MKRIKPFLRWVGVPLIFFIIMLFAYQKQNNPISGEPIMKEEVRKEKERSVYQLQESHVKYDTDSGIKYIDNIIILFFNTNATEKERKDIIQSIDGRIIGQLPEIDQYQIEIPEKSYQELKNLCEKLEALDVVDSAVIDLVIELDPQIGADSQ